MHTCRSCFDHATQPSTPHLCDGKCHGAYGYPDPCGKDCECQGEHIEKENT